MRKFLRAFLRIITAPFRFIFWVFRTIFRWIAGVFTNMKVFFLEEPEDAPLPDAFAKTIENPLGILEHLNALRKHLFRALVFLVITTAIAFTFIQPILSFLSSPLEGGLASLTAIDVTEPLGTVMRVALLGGFALAFPYIALEVWMFIAPGISRRSRLFSLLAIPIATLFFLGGMAFAFYVMMPTALPFLLNFAGITTIPRPSSYIKFVTGIMFWLGVAFEFPLVIYLLAGLGMVNAKMLSDQWRLAIVVIAVIAAAITPTVDPVNMALVMGPMIVLYFLSIGLAKIAQRNRT
jgi:sec-independent protein translocase protein TatC